MDGLRPFRRRPPKGTFGLPPAGLRDRDGGQECEDGFVHGDFSARNILVSHGEISGIVDFERSGRGCPVHDLASVYLHEVLLGEMDGSRFLTGYAAACGARETVDDRHLRRHLREYVCWVLSWAPAVWPCR
ncbi:phosphotransferase family protein [Micromonospora yangpuensis]|uniref:phosphotransferase family protein n=1 Tax=Micromonospora yangpuensis TaxID=683228 RepID=UPI00227A7178|nr:phosphotransferase [Micromonospora yangpuensis]